ncbi:hypothetical protein E8E12_003907 [Didymella heteroderae]|uniref:Heterokaryon incompatibility domain-containing protein n=1 Tax=Didymella heteroderae TaxID=1769908 RepID=A0A9P4WKW3_9PLEO|nr:hypothetical protein E8E12_003907 [Didymella heteroderae]
METKNWLTRDGDNQRAERGNTNNEYVTLSYCWGPPVSEDFTLQTWNYEEFSKGFAVGRLPQTLRDAVHFAARLESVGYIWIDALCIVQNSKEDWAQQSVQMDQIYEETYLNLSAAAPSDKKGGLYRHRNPALLKTEEVLLNTRGIPNAIPESNNSALVVSGADWAVSPTRATLDKYLRHNSDVEFLRTCTVLEVNYWSRRVDQAPVNKRGWVFQERCLSPRVLHFCEDQIAWECQGIRGCRGFTACEKQPNGLTNCYLTENDLRIAPRQSWTTDINGLDVGVEASGHINESSVARYNKSDFAGSAAAKYRKPDIRLDTAAMQLWARTVEAYSQKALTQPQDRLIALAGFAKLMAKRLNSRYAAGLWENDLEHQLLWYVDPEFNHRTRIFSQRAVVPREHCAPTFSWAAVDVTGYGLIYADSSFPRTYIKIKNCHVELREPTRRFGLLNGAHITMWCKLRQATLHTAENGRFCWYLFARDDELNHEAPKNVYLDCYERDKAYIDNLQREVYVVPVAIDQSFDMICLILRLHDEEKGIFQRIGLTKLTSFMDRMAMSAREPHVEHKILEVLPGDISLPHAGFDIEERLHMIHLT